MKQLKYELLLILAAVIWGCAFVAQSVAMSDLGPWFFNGFRNLIGSACLFALMPLLDRLRGKKDGTMKDKILIKAGLICGAAVAAGSIFQQMGLVYTTPGKAGFLTALYIVLVPILLLFFGKKAKWNIWAAVLIAAVGLYFLTMSESFSLSKGDILELFSALLWSVQILCVARYAAEVDGIRLSCMQFLVAGTICIIPGLIIEKPTISAVVSCWAPILYTGVLSCGVGYTLQIIGQQKLQPTIASLLMSLESVFSVIAGFLILHQALSAKELLGCLLIFAGIILAQIKE